MVEQLTGQAAPDALRSLRDSFELHLHNTRAPKTTVLYLAALDSLIAFLEDKGMPTGVRSVRREHIESWLGARRERIAPATLHIQYRALQQFFRWALSEEEIERDPMERIAAPRVPDKPVPVIDPEDFKKILATTEGRGLVARRDAAALLFLWDTGVRAGELLGMRLSDVELREGLAYVTGKGGHMRAVRFGSRTAVALDRYLRLRRGHRLAGLPAFWIGERGTCTLSWLATTLERRCAAVGLPRIHPHQFRHSHAHQQLANGMAEGDLMRLMGWRPGSAMIRRYGASMADERARAAYKSPVDRL